jgi:hypothetical protein
MLDDKFILIDFEALLHVLLLQVEVPESCTFTLC